MTRTLYVVGDAGVSPMPVEVGHPVELSHKDFRCDYKLGWPDDAYSGAVYGIDAVQALSLTLNMVAIHLYASNLHKQKRLYWEKLGDGYGFPLGQGDRNVAGGGDISL